MKESQGIPSVIMLVDGGLLRHTEDDYLVVDNVSFTVFPSRAKALRASRHAARKDEATGIVEPWKNYIVLSVKAGNNER